MEEIANGNEQIPSNLAPAILLHDPVAGTGSNAVISSLRRIKHSHNADSNGDHAASDGDPKPNAITDPNCSGHRHEGEHRREG